MDEPKKLTTMYGVPIETDAQGNPLCDAPGKYDRSAAAMGGPTEHLPPVRSDAYKLRLLADWFDAEQQNGRWSGEVREVQADLRRIADKMEPIEDLVLTITLKPEDIKELADIIREGVEDEDVDDTERQSLAALSDRELVQEAIEQQWWEDASEDKISEYNPFAAD